MEHEQLLKLSAKALGLELRYSSLHEGYIFDDENGWMEIWNPLLNDSQAMLLMAECKPTLMVGKDKYVEVEICDYSTMNFTSFEVWYKDHPSLQEALRYAIVLGAAEHYKLNLAEKAQSMANN